LEGCISLASLKDILEDVALGKIVYALHLKEYWIEPLFHSKMGIKPSIGDNPSIMETLWGAAEQVVETLQGGGDLEDLTRYFHRHGLLWLKQYVENMLRHLKCCVKEFPTLH